MHDLPGLQDVASDLLLDNPQLNVTLDRDRMAALGLSADQVESGDVQRLRFPADRPDLRAEQRLPGPHARGAEVSGRRLGVRTCCT